MVNSIMALMVCKMLVDNTFTKLKMHIATSTTMYFIAIDIVINSVELILAKARILMTKKIQVIQHPKLSAGLIMGLLTGRNSITHQVAWVLDHLMSKKMLKSL